MNATITTEETTLDSLAEVINENHDLVYRHASETLTCAKRCGDALVAVKDKLSHGEFLPWVETHSRVTPRECQRYMRLARSWENLPQVSPGEYLTLTEALRRLVEDVVEGESSNTTWMSHLVSDERLELGLPPIESESPIDKSKPIIGKVVASSEVLDDVPADSEFPRYVGAHVGRNTGQVEWYTPAEFIDSARKVMGGIDLDPASCLHAQEVVKAARYFTDEDGRCGLTSDWHIDEKLRVWMNPPYAQPLIAKFCEKLATEWDAKHVLSACVLVNNATETEWFYGLSSRCSAICFPRGRVKFWHPDRVSSTPLQGQAVIYLGDAVSTFSDEFSRYGRCFRS